MTIDHDGDTPVYQQLANILRAQIAAGDYRPRRPLPSEKQLQETYALGRDSVRHAIKVLREEGVVYTVQAKGTFVSPRDREPESRFRLQ